MLSPQESKVVLSTLTKRRAWLLKTLEDPQLDDDQRKEYGQTLTTLDSAMRKLATACGAPAPGMPPASPVKSAASPQRRVLSMQTARVLVAEDNKESAELLVGLLGDFGIKHVDLAKDGREAFDRIKLARDPYDIILCDWDMPELSGIEVHQKAYASNTLRGAHFCMVTGVSEAQKIREAIQQGINDYIVKPIDASILEGKIKATLANKAQQHH